MSVLSAIGVLFAAAPCWFVDGFHGGVYGHYPLQDYTDFMCDQLEANPEWSIGLEIEPETWDRIAETAPDQLARLRALARTPRVEFTNPTYAQPYLWNLSGESVIRQFSLGLEKLHHHFPDVEIVTYAAEEPCFTSCLPAVLRGFGFKYAVLRCPNTCWGGYPAAHGGEMVLMEGPDGTRIKAVPRPACEALQSGSVWQTKSWGNEADYLDACRAAGIAHPVGMTYQDAGWRNGPWLGRGGKVRNGSLYTTWRRYFEEVATEEPTDVWRFSQEDVMPSLMWGASVMNTLARQVRRAENALVHAEKLDAVSALAERRAFDGRGDFAEAWRTLALAQHHDSWIVPYNGLMRRGMTWADWIARWTFNSVARAEGVVARSASALGAAGSGGRLLVVNTLGRARRAFVSFPATDEGAAFDFPAEVPAFGSASFSREEAKRFADAAPRCRVVERTKKLLVVDSGAVRLAFDLARGGVGQATVRGAARAVGFGELRGFFYEEVAWRSSADSPAVVEVRGENAPRMTIAVRGLIAGSPFEERYVVSAGSVLVEGTLKIDWCGNPGIGEGRQDAKAVMTSPRRMFSDGRFKLGLLFPDTFRAPKLWKNAPFDVCESRLGHTWTGDWRDLRHNVILDWLDVSEGRGGEGLAVFTDHIGAYDFGEGHPLSLTVQYSGFGLWGRDYRITGPTEMAFAFAPHAGTWEDAELEHLRMARAEPLVAVLADCATSPWSLLGLSNPGFEISSCRRIGDRTFELRLYHASGSDDRCTVNFGFPVASISETDLRGWILRSLDPTASVRVSFPKLAFRTYVVVCAGTWHAPKSYPRPTH